MQTQQITQFDAAANWRTYFDIDAALRNFTAHIAALPSSQTRAKHTARVYTQGLTYWREWSLDTLPTPQLLTQYIAHLKHQRKGRSGMGLKSSTVRSKYMAPLRLYLKTLSNQQITGLHGAERDFVEDCRNLIRAALAVPNPKPDTTSNRPALYQHGERLALSEVNQVFQSLTGESLIEMRDLAIMYCGLTTGIRLAELQRITLDKIKKGDDCYELHVIGKRNNVDPVPIDSTAVNLIRNYVDAYNDATNGEEDPRYITADTPVWQPLTPHGNIQTIEARRKRNFAPMAHDSLRYIINTRTEAATGRKISPHDMRRTVAAISRAHGMEFDQIQRLLRHKSIETTAKYVGNPEKLSRSLVSNIVPFTVNTKSA